MKTLIAVIALIIAVNAINQEILNQLKSKMKEQVESCAKEVSANQNDIADILSHKVPESHEGKCIFFCMHKIYNAQNDDGSLNMAGAMENFELIKDVDSEFYSKMVAAFKNCESTPSDGDPCIFATSLVQCIVKESKILGLDESVIE